MMPLIYVCMGFVLGVVATVALVVGVMAWRGLIH